MESNGRVWVTDFGLARCQTDAPLTRLDTGDSGVLAVEPFDYWPDGMGSASRAIGYLKGIVEGLDCDD